MKSLIVILYDSIANSVFESQVLQPLIKQLHKKKQHIHIISFEKNTNIKVPECDGIQFHIFKRYPFIHHLFLQRETRIVHTFLKQIGYEDIELLARGPFAGYIALKSAEKKCTITIQARGLVAEEYRYIHAHNNNLKLLHRLRYKQFKHFEQIVYSAKKSNLIIQAVSESLKHYLIDTFDATAQNITIAQDDIPPQIDEATRTKWHHAKRTELQLNNRYIYCYNGSFKPWQCPEKIIEFFKQQYAKDSTCYLLILTPDIVRFDSALQKEHINQNSYRVLCVAQDQLQNYLAAADVGLLFREKDIINTVSRPTKALDYQAARLPIMHNGTVDYVQNMPAAICCPTAL